MLKSSKIIFIIGLCSVLLVPGLSIANSLTTEPVVTAAPQSENQVNINRAGVDELASKIKGIGLKKAQQIVEFREKHGLFTRVEQLQDVPGIGAHILQQNLAILTL